ncbi:MAG: histidine-type phosphatase [Muribaculaceae bacterium]|nr:histidine-type phosphatase [Muribaculaceae bacterium]
MLTRPVHTILFLLAAILTINAQTTREAMLADPLKCAGVYAPYPDTVWQLTPVPDGYEPFYVSHYGRHGSRYLINETDYTNVFNALGKAREAGALTPRGLEVYDIVAAATEEARGRAGELSPLGYRQHHDIASRLLDECAPAFSDGADVTATSTVRMRCAYSMFSFVSRLKEFNPGLDIPLESGSRHMYYMSYNNPAAQAFNDAGAAWQSTLRDFKQSQTRPDRLMAALFTDPDKAADYIAPADLMWGLYWIAIDLPNMECDASLFDIFTPDELFDLWQVFNYEFYTRNSCNPINNGVFLESAKSLLANIIDNADAYIADGRHGATLRFGHDSTLIPLAGLLGFATASGRESDPARLYHTYADYRVSPMASNIQIRFYRNADGDILVKFLLNESETALGDTPTDNYPYYKWSDARATLLNILNTPVKL